MATLAIPATAAAFAYLNARWALYSDWHLLSSLVRARIAWRRRLRRDRVNNFYILEEHAHNAAIKDKPFLIYEDRQWTFQQTYDTVLRYAGWIQDTHKVTSGEIVAIDMMNRPSFIFLAIALWSLGAVPALINYNLTGPSLIHCIRSSTARLVFIDPELHDKFTPEVMKELSSPVFRNASLPLTLITLSHELESSLAYFPPFRALDSVRSIPLGRTPCALMFTSGTTGFPKPATMSWERMVAGGGGMIYRWMGLRPANDKSPDRFYTPMPLYHGTAFGFGFNVCLNNAVTFCLGHKFSTSRFWSDVRSSKATIIQYVGETLRYLLNTPINPALDKSHSVRMAFGNGLQLDTWDAFKRRFNIPTVAEFYAATDGTSATLNLSSNTFASGAIGHTGSFVTNLFLATSLAMVNVDWDTEEPSRDPTTNFCQRVPRGQPGELIYKLNADDIKATFAGYFGNESATEKKILRSVFKPGDAWYRTGDVVKLDTEGRMWFSDRIGDTFRWKSENVSTTEVSQVLSTHPQILDANVYGVEIPGHEGRAGCAAVLLANSSQQKNPPDEKVLESVATFATNMLPNYAVPLFLRVVNQPYTTGNNKQVKAGLRKEGVDPALVSAGEPIYWLRPGSGRYELFGSREWDDISGGRAKL